MLNTLTGCGFKSLDPRAFNKEIPYLIELLNWRVTFHSFLFPWLIFVDFDGDVSSSDTLVSWGWTSFCIPQYQTARAILVIWIILDHFTSVGYSVLHLRHTYVSGDALINGMFRKLILAVFEFFTYFIDYCHVNKISAPISWANSPMPNAELSCRGLTVDNLCII